MTLESPSAMCQMHSGPSLHPTWPNDSTRTIVFYAVAYQCYLGISTALPRRPNPDTAEFTRYRISTNERRWVKAALWSCQSLDQSQSTVSQDLGFSHQM